MTNKLTLSFTLILLCSVATQAMSQEPRFSKRIPLESNKTLVVAEGQGEPASTGSYSIRLYSKHVENPLYIYLAGSMHGRSGSVQDVRIEDITNDGRSEVIVSMHRQGSVNYLSADVFELKEDGITLMHKVEYLEPESDIINEIKLDLMYKDRISTQLTLN